MENMYQNKYVIHIDLYDTIFDKNMREFLFKFLILKYYGYNDRIFSYDYNKVKIKIELPNTHINYFKKFKILEYLKKEKNISNKNEIIINDYHKNNKIQIVGNILKMYENDQIKNKNFIINKEQANVIENNQYEEYKKLINNTLIANVKKYKNKEHYYPNLYQINIFINFLYSEFCKFMECIHLDPEVVLMGNNNDKNIIDNLRKDIIKSLIDNSIYFTFTSFDKIINEKNESMNYDELIKNLENERKNNIIKYDNINPSILAFHEDGQNFSIIATNKDDEKFKSINAYLYFLNLEEIYLFQQREDKSNKNHKKKKIIQIPEELEKEGKLLDELLKIMSLDENLINKIKEIIKNNKILKDYVFTNDNFVKMYLLIMRIRAEIPTIIMGETGCGKTRLLQMFCFLYNCTQEYFINNGNIAKMNNFDNYIWILRFN